MMEFKRKDNMIYLDIDGQDLAYIKFAYHDDYIEAYSTFVDTSLRGQGVAQKLVDALVAVAKEENKRINPTCSYVVNLFEKKHEKYSDIQY